MKKRFVNGIRNRGFTPVKNAGDKNSVFMSLAELVFGDANRFEFVRYMIVHRLRRFPEKYFHNTSESPDYCNNMATFTRPPTHKELQVAADIFFAVIECYSLEDYKEPTNIIYPLRAPKVSTEHVNTLRIWT